MSYQLLTILLPIITVPYVSRALGSSGVGIYAYTFAIAHEFALFGSLGINNYAIRQIAYFRNDLNKRNENFVDIFTLQLTTTLFSCLIFILFVITSGTHYRVIFLIQILNIVSSSIDVSWFFIGLEEFKKTVTRNTMVKVGGLVLILTFVKNTSDLILYTIIISSVQFLGQLTLITYIRKYVKLRRPNIRRIVAKIRPVLGMFIPQITIEIYSVINKIVLGSMQPKSQVGYFDSADKISRIILQVLIAISAVMYPKIANLYANHNHEKIKDYLYMTVQIVSIISLPMMVGLASISKWFVPWFFGNSFKPTIPVLMVMSLVVWVLPFSTILSNQFLLPTNRIRENTIAGIVGAIVSLITNFIFIPKFAAIGAAIATVMAEGTVLMVSLIFISRIFSIKKLLVPMIRYLLFSLIMAFFVVEVGEIVGVAKATTTILQCITGIISYLVILVVFDKRNMIFYIKMLKNLKKS